MKLRLLNGEKMLPEGTFMASELSKFIGRNLLITPLDGSDNITKMNKLAGVTEMVISWNELDNNSDNLEGGKPSNVLLTYHVTDSEEFTRLNQFHPNIRNLRAWSLLNL